MKKQLDSITDFSMFELIQCKYIEYPNNYLPFKLSAYLIKTYDTHKVFIAQDRIVITNNDNEEIKSWDVLNITLDDVQ